MVPSFLFFCLLVFTFVFVEKHPYCCDGCGFGFSNKVVRAILHQRGGGRLTCKLCFPRRGGGPLQLLRSELQKGRRDWDDVVPWWGHPHGSRRDRLKYFERHGDDRRQGESVLLQGATKGSAARTVSISQAAPDCDRHHFQAPENEFHHLEQKLVHRGACQRGSPFGGKWAYSICRRPQGRVSSIQYGTSVQDVRRGDRSLEREAVGASSIVRNQRLSKRRKARPVTLSAPRTQFGCLPVHTRPFGVELLPLNCCPPLRNWTQWRPYEAQSEWRAVSGTSSS